MGQQPNIELGISDLPRPKAHPAPARRWRADRPGDIASPEQMPSGGAFGTIGPDAGYATRLVRGRSLDLRPGESAHNAMDAVATLAAARAARAGRGPISQDVDVAVLILGYDATAMPPDQIDAVAAARITLAAGIGHSAGKAAALIDAIEPSLLDALPADVRDRLAGGERPLRV